MATRVADRILLDTNVLLAATDESRSEHLLAVAALDVWPGAGTVLYTSGQILREYLAVATRPLDRNGLGLTRMDAVANVRALRARLRFLDEDAKVADRLAQLIEQIECAGKQVHDAQVVATALVHGIESLATSNAGDFARFSGLLHVIDLVDTAGVLPGSD